MALLRRRTKPLSVNALKARAEASAALAAADKAALKFQTEAELAQRVVQRDADALAVRCSDADRWDAERTEISSKLTVATRNAFDLSERIERCRTAIDDALKSGSVEEASSHGTALGSMALTLQRAQAIVEALQNDYQSVPTSDLTADERADLPKSRSIAKSPARSHAHVVPGLTPDPAEEYRRLGRAVAAEQLLHPHFVNTPRPMVDAR